MEDAIEQFQNIFPKIAEKVDFAGIYPKPEPKKRRLRRRGAAAAEKKEEKEPNRFASVKEMCGFLDTGFLLLLNVQSMTFDGAKIVQGTTGDSDGHCVCCVGYDKDKKILLIHDSNKVKKKCKKTISMKVLQENATTLENMSGGKSDIAELTRAQTSLMHISQMYTVKKKG